MSKICTCRICRQTIRRQIEWTFVERPRWMGLYAIRFHGHLGWVPMRFYRSILARMVRLGILIKSSPDPSDSNQFPRYLLARCMSKIPTDSGVPAQVLAQPANGEGVQP